MCAGIPVSAHHFRAANESLLNVFKLISGGTDNRMADDMLLKAVKIGHRNRVKQLLEAGGVDVEACDHEVCQSALDFNACY
jgi:hypothetical protein